MAANLRLSGLALLLGGLWATPAAWAGLGPIKVLSGEGEAFEAEIPLVDENTSGNVLVGLADRNHYPLLSGYSDSAGNLRFSLEKRADGGIQKILVKGPASFQEPLLRFAVELSWPAGRVVREFEVDYHRDAPRKRDKAPQGGDEKKPMASGASSAGMEPLVAGELKVTSKLGEPLMAELPLYGSALEHGVEVNLSADAVSGETPSRQQLQLVSDISHQLLSLPSERKVLQLRSSQPMNEPVLALRLELTAGGSKLLKQYTLLLDPSAGASVTESPAPRREPAGGAFKTYRVSPGDTLSAIASRVHGAGGSEKAAQQLFDGNHGAFISGNINRLRAGAALHYPAGWRLSAHRVAHPANAAPQALAAEQKLAAAIAPPAAKAGSATVVDAAKPSPAQAARSTADKAAEAKLQAELKQQDQALRQAEQRASQLEEKIRQFQAAKAAMASAPAAQLKPMLAASAPEAVKAPAHVESKAQASQPQALAAAKQPESKPTVVAVASSPAAIPAQLTAPHAAPAPATASKPAPAPVKEEPSLVDNALAALSDDAVRLPLAGGAAVVGLLALLLAQRRKRKVAGAAPRVAEAKPGEGHSLLTLGPLTTLMSALKKGDGIDLGSVDLIAEAEVYLAYGREDQALDILREGLVHEPMRQDLRYKMLEVMSGQEDKSQFLAEATVAKGMFGKDSTMWQRVCELGHSKLPDHPLFQSAATQPAAAPAPAPQARMAMPAPAAAPAAPPAKSASVPEAPLPMPELEDLDFPALPPSSGPTPGRSARPVTPEATAKSPNEEKMELAKLYLEMGDRATAEALMKEASQG